MLPGKHYAHKYPPGSGKGHPWKSGQRNNLINPLDRDVSNKAFYEDFVIKLFLNMKDKYKELKASTTFDTKVSLATSKYVRDAFNKADILSLSKKIDMDGFTSEGFKYLNALGR